jgi:predicted small lipoprotein YifL
VRSPAIGAHPQRLAVALVLLASLLAACGESGPLPFLPTPEPTPEQPRELMVVALERGTDTPLAGVSLSVEGETAQTGEDGRGVVVALPGSTVEVAADGYDPASGTVPAEGDLTLELRPNVVSGTVTDDTGKPIENVRVFVDGSDTLVRTDARGRYALGGVPEEGSLIYKMPGYRLGVIPIDAEMAKDVALEPFAVRALYAPGLVFEGVGRLDELLALVDRSEANALVIDVKETDGWLYYETDLPEAAAAGSDKRPILDLEELLPALKERGIYLIARMVVMKDNTVGVSRPELAVRNSATGEPWRDFGGGVWLDPYNPGVAEYIAAIAGDLAAKGFDEVQLDYVRFYSDGDFSVADPNLPNTQSFRLPAIRRLFRLVSDELATTRAFLAADVFPISFIAPDDQGIGQRPEVIMPYVDYFSPMVYPSHYASGTFGYAVPNNHPYEIIDETLQIMNDQAAGLPMVIRPWIQDFGLPPVPRYTAAQVRAEMKALSDNGAIGWMIWHAAAHFTESALGPPREGEEYAPTTSAAPPDGSAAPSASP